MLETKKNFFLNQNVVNAEKSSSNEHLVRSPFASILLFAPSFWRSTAGRLWPQIFCRWRFSHILVPLRLIPDTLNDVEISVLWGLCHHFHYFFMVKIKLNDFSLMFGVIVLLQNIFGANYTPPWWYCMMVRYLPVFFSIKNNNNSDQISNSLCRNIAPHH